MDSHAQGRSRVPGEFILHAYVACALPTARAPVKWQCLDVNKPGKGSSGSSRVRELERAPGGTPPAPGPCPARRRRCPLCPLLLPPGRARGGGEAPDAARLFACSREEAVPKVVAAAVRSVAPVCAPHCLAEVDSRVSPACAYILKGLGFRVWISRLSARPAAWPRSTAAPAAPALT